MKKTKIDMITKNGGFTDNIKVYRAVGFPIS